MIIPTLYCEVCRQFQIGLVIKDPPYSVCSVHEEGKFNDLLGYDRGEMPVLPRFENTLPKIQKAPQ